MMDKIGRRRTLLTFTTFNFLAGYGLLIASFHQYMIWCGRFLCGVAVGSDLAVSTAYITEISKKDVRGALGFLVQLMGSLGMGSSVEFVLFEIGFGPDFMKFDRICN